MNIRPGDQDPLELELLKRHAFDFKALRDRASLCPHPELISAAVTGVLPGASMALVKAHMDTCPLCSLLRDGLANPISEDFEDHAQTARLLARIRAGIAKEERTRRWFDWPFAHPVAVAMASVVVVVLAIVSIRWTLMPPKTQTAQTPSSNPGAPAAQVFLLPLEQAELKLPLDAIRWRASEDPSTREYFAEFGKALEPYNKNDFTEAAKTLTSLGSRYPEAVEPYFYLGVSQTFNGRPTEARVALERARRVASPALAADIDWYLAVANEREGRPAQSAAFLEGLCGRENIYQKQACALVPRMKAKAR